MEISTKHLNRGRLADTVLGGYDGSDDNANPNTFQHWRAEFLINIGEIGKNNGIMQRQSLVLSAAAIFISVLAYGMAIRIALLSTALYAMRYSRYTIIIQSLTIIWTFVL